MFSPESVARLTQKAASGAPLGEADNMALAGILSTQLVYQQFIKSFRLAPARLDDRAKIVDRVGMDHEQIKAMQSEENVR